ncbi:MAG TPA: M23 family metallopeptidase [Polyangia bacterium]|jgi:murein DD-endopeptidase MepM/ murein hydrolase activator NlpD|nr:M23 family metallopeptidase [Polyangia bacterium]
MSEAIDTISPLPTDGLSLGTCARCGDPVDVRTRHLIIDGPAVRTFCSQACATKPAELAPAPSPPRRARAQHLLRIGVALPMLVFTSGYTPQQAPHAAPAMVSAAPASVTPAEPPSFGPAWPPTEKDWLAEIASDAWLHPLDGPVRRMPIRDARVFGAERPGDRPGECRGGHCGVDLGGEVWGEPVHAAHDGVVDRVQRGPNDEHGGLYVRLSHRGGTIFTQYFHLAAIPRWIQPGVKVKIGDVVGLVGDTGVKHSSAHLHFTVSVKPSAEVVERYIDPEPLVALWPLRMPIDNNSAMVTASAAPGVPLGAAGGRPHHHKIARAPVQAPTDDAAAAE